MLLGLDWHESEIDKGLELDIGGWLKSMKEELEFLIMVLSLNFNDVMKISFLVCFERYVHLDSQASSEGALHVVLNREFGSLGRCKFEPSDTLADISNCDSNLIILIRFDIYYENGSYTIKTSYL